MERKRALAVATTATCLLGSSAIAFAATVGVPVLGFGRSGAGAAEVSTVWKASTTPPARRVVTRTKDVYDTVVLDVPEVGSVVMGDPPPTTTRPRATERDDDGVETSTTMSGRRDDDRTEGDADDSPPDRTIQPAPRDCHEPQLEDSGVWNCDDD
jgi:hypothetical protein